MPPKADAAESVSIDTFRFVLSVVSSAGAINPDWNAVAAENGIGYARNATSKFKQLMKKYNYSFEGNALVKMDEDGNAADADAKNNTGNSKASTPKTPKARKAGAAKTPASKKRKVDNGDAATAEVKEEDGKKMVQEADDGDGQVAEEDAETA